MPKRSMSDAQIGDLPRYHGVKRELLRKAERDAATIRRRHDRLLTKMGEEREFSQLVASPKTYSALALLAEQSQQLDWLYSDLTYLKTTNFVELRDAFGRTAQVLSGPDSSKEAVSFIVRLFGDHVDEDFDVKAIAQFLFDAQVAMDRAALEFQTIIESDSRPDRYNSDLVSFCIEAYLSITGTKKFPRSIEMKHNEFSSRSAKFVHVAMVALESGCNPSQVKTALRRCFARTAKEQLSG